MQFLPCRLKSLGSGNTHAWTRPRRWLAISAISVSISTPGISLLSPRSATPMDPDPATGSRTTAHRTENRRIRCRSKSNGLVVMCPSHFAGFPAEMTVPGNLSASMCSRLVAQSCLPLPKIVANTPSPRACGRTIFSPCDFSRGVFRPINPFKKSLLFSLGHVAPPHEMVLRECPGLSLLTPE